MRSLSIRWELDRIRNSGISGINEESSKFKINSG